MARLTSEGKRVEAVAESKAAVVLVLFIVQQRRDCEESERDPRM